MHGFHVTQTKDVPSILMVGLEPRIGPRSSIKNESHPAVFFFNDRNGVMDAVTNWMGDLFDKDEPLALLYVIVPLCFRHTIKFESFEFQVFDRIPPNCITVLEHKL